ncbi:MAG: N-acetylglucosamine-6-phosphate deacetylase [Pseudomonadota bacterium]|jgi:N-acetylglucosamine-6-phosphate deacetylase
MTIALVGGRVLLADGFADGTVVLVKDGLITDIKDESDALPAHCTLRDLGGRYLVPGFIDTQVNGGGGVLLNETPTVAGIAAIAAAHRRFGVTGLLPTLISDELAVVEQAVAAITAAIRIGVPGVLGMHIEGPFLADGRRGIHNEQYFRALDAAAITLLARPTGGRTLVTLAPERATLAQIATLVEHGVVVSLGHTDATAQEAFAAFDAGVTGITHLYNAMSPLMSRSPGVVGAAFLDHRPWCGLIVDGHHVDPLSLRVALAIRPHDRFMLVSDAMQCVGTAMTTFDLLGSPIQVRDGACRDEDGTLAGSAVDLLSCIRKAAQSLGLPLATVFRMASQYPADFLGLSATHGRIAPGCRADLVAVDARLENAEVLF